MGLTPDQGSTREWYGRLPAAFRDADIDADLWSFLRLLGDFVGGTSLVVDVLEGNAFIRPITLSDGTVLTLGEWLTVDGPDDTGLGVPILLDSPVTELDGDDPDILVITSGDWTLTDPLTWPAEWVPWGALTLGIDLSLVPQRAWREWIANPVSRAVGSLPSLLALAAYHLEDLTVPVVTRPAFRQITLTVAAASITTSEEELQAVLTAAEPAGVKVILATT